MYMSPSSTVLRIDDRERLLHAFHAQNAPLCNCSTKQEGYPGETPISLC